MKQKTDGTNLATQLNALINQVDKSLKDLNDIEMGLYLAVAEDYFTRAMELIDADKRVILRSEAYFFGEQMFKEDDKRLL